MKFLKNKIGKQGRWPNTLFLFLFPILVLLSFRWFLFEPFVIPSESMVPNLLIHDHIAVKKWSYGIKPPVGDGWLLKWQEPKRGDVVVFRFPENRNVFYIKRLVGLPGDHIKTKGMNLWINEKLIALSPGEFERTFIETIDANKHIVQFNDQSNFDDERAEDVVVPQNSYFVMGDNRYSSYDSRFWGVVPSELLVGKAVKIWMSCEDTLESMTFLCDPKKFRWNRFFKDIE